MQGAEQPGPPVLRAVGAVTLAVPVASTHFRTWRTAAVPLLSTNATWVPSVEMIGEVVTLPAGRVLTLYAHLTVGLVRPHRPSGLLPAYKLLMPTRLAWPAVPATFRPKTM